jgi:hypothetical protein
MSFTESNTVGQMILASVTRLGGATIGCISPNAGIAPEVGPDSRTTGARNSNHPLENRVTPPSSSPEPPMTEESRLGSSARQSLQN